MAELNPPLATFVVVQLFKGLTARHIYVVWWLRVKGCAVGSCFCECVVSILLCTHIFILWAGIA